jgi:hypothetical protein
VKKLVNGAWIVVGICVAVRIGADLVAPVLAPLVALVFVGSLFFWVVGRR